MNLQHKELKSDEVARLHLWQTALRETRMLLALARRAWAAKDTAAVIDKENEYTQARNAYIRSRPDYAPGIQKLSHFLEFETANPRPLGDSLDYFGFYDACRMLAIIFFCQLFKSGYEDKSVVAGNSRLFVNEQLAKLLQRANFSDAELIDFELLRQRAETARDKMLAHAEGPEFDFQEMPTGFHFKMPIASLDGIDFALLADFSKRLEDSLQIYLRPGLT